VDDLWLIGVLLLMLTMTGIDWGGGWVWPVPSRAGSPALISQEFHAPAHLGVDIMYREGGKWTAPEGTPILAARDGKVWSTGQTARGHNVVLDHGAPWATFYQHLTEVLVAKGQAVVAGQRIGTMGADPTDQQGLRHLHFETWYKGNGEHAVDPGPAMATWRRVVIT
jgi:murein DD-endopeptidase MepM/ murein hydrolase activator NlpD